MAISQTAAFAKIRDRIGEIDSAWRVYAAGETDDNAVPLALNEFPAVLIVPGPTLRYILQSGQHEHEYEVKVMVMVAGGNLGDRANTALPMPTQIIEKFTGQVRLGGTVTSCLFERSSGFVTLEYAGNDYLGYEITLNVIEHASATTASGT